MRAALVQTANLAVTTFAVASMFSVGLAHTVRAIVRPLRELRAVFRALVANFVLVPLLAVAIERLIPMDSPLALGLFLLAGAAGAPFVIKLAEAARSDMALSAALLVLLVPATVVFLPFYVPLAMAHPSLVGLTYLPSSILALGLPLVSTMILPLLAGLAVKAAAPRVAVRLLPLLARLTSVALVLIVVVTLLANAREVARIFTSGAIVAAVLLVVGSFAVGYLLARRERAAVLGMGTAQRNIAAAMLVAARSFGDPDVLVMVTVTSLAGFLLLFPVAWLLSRRTPRVGPPSALPLTSPEPA